MIISILIPFPSRIACNSLYASFYLKMFWISLLFLIKGFLTCNQLLAPSIFPSLSIFSSCQWEIGFLTLCAWTIGTEYILYVSSSCPLYTPIVSVQLPNHGVNLAHRKGNLEVLQASSSPRRIPLWWHGVVLQVYSSLKYLLVYPLYMSFIQLPWPQKIPICFIIASSSFQPRSSALSTLHLSFSF